MSEYKKPESPDDNPVNEENDAASLTDELSARKAVPTKPPHRVIKEPPRKNCINYKREIIDFLRDLFVCLIIVIVTVEFITRPVQVKGNSMYPTLTDGAFGFSDILGYRLFGIERFDIVIVYLEEKDEYLVKRVVGMPGETVSYRDGQLYINDEPVAEDFLDETYVSSYGGAFTGDIAEVTLRDDEYYCLGDNRPNSSDSRFYGPFQKDDILSKGIFILFPFSDFGAHTW